MFKTAQFLKNAKSIEDSLATLVNQINISLNLLKQIEESVNSLDDIDISENKESTISQTLFFEKEYILPKDQKMLQDVLDIYNKFQPQIQAISSRSNIILDEQDDQIVLSVYIIFFIGGES